MQWQWHLIASLGWGSALVLSQVVDVRGAAHDVALVNNGVGVRRLGARLSVLRPRILAITELPARHRVAVAASLVVSQAAWWTAAVVGFLVTLSRR